MLPSDYPRIIEVTGKLRSFQIETVTAAALGNCGYSIGE
jgi:hypothetical protein